MCGARSTNENTSNGPIDIAITHFLSVRFVMLLRIYAVAILCKGGVAIRRAYFRGAFIRSAIFA
jgi:hypothetical protein